MRRVPTDIILRIDDASLPCQEIADDPLVGCISIMWTGAGMLDNVVHNVSGSQRHKTIRPDRFFRQDRDAIHFPAAFCRFAGIPRTYAQMRYNHIMCPDHCLPQSKAWFIYDSV